MKIIEIKDQFAKLADTGNTIAKVAVRIAAGFMEIYGPDTEACESTIRGLAETAFRMGWKIEEVE